MFTQKHHGGAAPAESVENSVRAEDQTGRAATDHAVALVIGDEPSEGEASPARSRVVRPGSFSAHFARKSLTAGRSTSGRSRSSWSNVRAAGGSPEMPRADVYGLGAANAAAGAMDEPDGPVARAVRSGGSGFISDLGEGALVS